MKKHQLLLFVGLAISLNIKGQLLFNQEKISAGHYSGYVVTINQDTIYGKIIVPISFYKLCKEVEFIDRNNHTTTYYPEDLLSFHFENTHFIGNSKAYTHSDPYFGQAFLQQLVEGFISYYRYIYLELTSAGPLLVPKLSEDFYYSYGSLKPNLLHLFNELIIFTQDRPETYDTLFNKKFIREDMPKILNNYNNWVISSSKSGEKMKLDSIYASTKLNLETAFKDSLLFLNNNEQDMYSYYLRIPYYASNTPGFQSFEIYNDRDDQGNTLLIGIKVNIAGKFFKTGTWRYYYPESGKAGLQIKKEEHYDFNGKKHGVFTSYDVRGKITKTELFEQGKQKKKNSKN
ncbi:MAG: hypothetical protein JXB49_01170 [Bacteroidales bacterium]|nr:hypothetical protein [Bacteroidales bacterium]